MRILATVSACALAATSLASADFVDMQFVGTGAGQVVKITSPSRTGNLWVGQILHVISNGPANLNGQWITYCADLGQTVSGSPVPYEIVPVAAIPDSAPMGAAKAQAIADMYAYANGSQLLPTTSNDLAAAFQLAIWEVVADYTGVGPTLGLDMTSGNFAATMTDGSPLSAGIAGYVASLLGAVGTNASRDLIGLRSGSYQDQILEVPGPGALALAATAGLVARRRRA
ncbi:MAG: hypothetical protein U0636_08020 [Phycisphaerales bacterium]